VKKFLLVLVLFAVTFQSAWAASGAYCRHEKGALSFHFGHHSHHHQGKGDPSEKKVAFGKVHFDCSSCHAASPALTTASTTVDAVIFSKSYPYAVATIYTSYISDGPQRPDRPPVA
jgi:hypothetical protein